MSSNNASNSSLLYNSQPLKICRHSSTPEEWTQVNEYNIEKKDSYKEWVHTIHSRLYTLEQEFLSYFVTLQQLDEEIEREHKKLTLLKTTPRTPITEDSQRMQEELIQEGQTQLYQLTKSENKNED